MTPKEALEDIKTIDIVIDGCKWNYKDTDHKESVEVIEQSLTELEELKRDVKRYFELKYKARNGLTDKEAVEHTKLFIKISKVGTKDV